MNYLELLKAGREIISNPDNWCQDGIAFAENSVLPISACDSKAVSWCSVGALYKANGRDSVDNDLMQAYCALEAMTPGGSIPKYNDTYTHEEVLALWDRTIAMVTAKIASEAHDKELKA